MVPDLIGSASARSTNMTFANSSPIVARRPPIRPATAASRMNGSWVYHRDAPTSRMIEVSVRRWNAATWMVFEISSNAANNWISAITRAAMRTLLNRLKIRSRMTFWLDTSSTPGDPENPCWITAYRSGWFSVTTNEAGRYLGSAIEMSPWFAANNRLYRSYACCCVRYSTPLTSGESDSCCWSLSRSAGLLVRTEVDKMKDIYFDKLQVSVYLKDNIKPAERDKLRRLDVVL